MFYFACDRSLIGAQRQQRRYDDDDDNDDEDDDVSIWVD